MSPGGLLAIILFVTAMAAGCQFLLRKTYRRRLQRIAEEWRMNYSPADQFRLTPRVARSFPVAGAANIRVIDLIYGSADDEYRYIFTAEYTAGIVSGKHRVLRAGTFTEPRDCAGSGGEPRIVLAPKHLPLIEQYRRLAPEAGGVGRENGTGGEGEKGRLGEGDRGRRGQGGQGENRS